MLLVAPAWDLVWLLTSAAHRAPALLLSPHPGWESLFFLLSGHYPVCIMPGLQKTHAHPHSPLRQLTSHPYHPRLFRSLHTCPCFIPTWFQPSEKQHLPRLLLLALCQACASPGPFCPTPSSKRPRYVPGQELFAFLDYLSLQNFFRVLNGIFTVVTACLFFWNVFKCLKLAYEMQRIQATKCIHIQLSKYFKVTYWDSFKIIKQNWDGFPSIFKRFFAKTKCHF